MLEATAVVTLNYKSANQAEVAITPCADIVAGQSASVQAKATPAGGQYDWAGSGGVQVRGAGASATVTGAQPGRGRVQVRYTAPNGRSASDDKPVTCLRVNGLNGGAPVPQIGLYGEDGKPISTPTIVALSVEPGDAGDRLSFKPANAALLSVTGRGDALMLQGVQPGKTQITGKTLCGQSVGGPWPVEVSRCTDDVVAKLAEQERIARQEVLKQVAEAGRTLDSQEFKDAADGLGRASGDVILKTGALITGVLSGGKSTATTKVVSDVIGHAVNVRDMVNAENGWEQVGSSLQEFVQITGGPLAQAIAGAIDLLKTTDDFGNKLGKVMGTNEKLESIRKNIDNFQRQHEDIVRRQKICKEPQGQPPREPEPPKTEPPKPAPPKKAPGQPPRATPPAQPPEPPAVEPPSVPPPPYQPPPRRTVGLPFDQGCTCGAGRGLTVSAVGLAMLETGLKQMNSCNIGFANQTRDLQGALEVFSAILGEMSHASEVPPELRAARAKDWSARLGTVVDKSKKFEAAGKAVLQNGKACPAAMDASLGMMNAAATSPLAAR